MNARQCSRNTGMSPIAYSRNCSAVSQLAHLIDEWSQFGNRFGGKSGKLCGFRGLPAADGSTLCRSVAAIISLTRIPTVRRNSLRFSAGPRRARFHILRGESTREALEKMMTGTFLNCASAAHVVENIVPLNFGSIRSSTTMIGRHLGKDFEGGDAIFGGLHVKALALQALLIHCQRDRIVFDEENGRTDFIILFRGKTSHPVTRTTQSTNRCVFPQHRLCHGFNAKNNQTTEPFFALFHYPHVSQKSGCLGASGKPLATQIFSICCFPRRIARLAPEVNESPMNTTGFSTPKRLASRGFWSLFITQFQGAFSDNALKLVILYLFPAHLRCPGSRQTSYGIVSALFPLPFILFSMAGGFLADRFSKRSVTHRRQEFSKLAVMALALFGLVRICNYVMRCVFLMGVAQRIFGCPNMACCRSCCPNANSHGETAFWNWALSLPLFSGPSRRGWLSQNFCRQPLGLVSSLWPRRSLAF